MTPKPLADIGFSPHDHLSALWWAALVYRWPQRLESEGEHLPRRSRVRVYLAIYFHVFICAGALFIVGGCLVAAMASGTPWGESFRGFVTDKFIFVLLFALLGSLVCLLFGLFGGLVVCFDCGFVIGLVVGPTFGLVTGDGPAFDPALALGVAFGLLFGLVFGLVGVAFGLVFGLGLGLAMVLSLVTDENARSAATAAMFASTYFPLFLLIFLRPYYLPIHTLFIWPRPRPKSYQHHFVVWDHACRLPFPGLDRLLADYHGLARTEAIAEIDRLVDVYPSQRVQAQRARARVLARTAGQEQDLAKLTDLLAPLPVGKRGFLAETESLRKKVARITRQQLRVNQADRAIFRRTEAADLVREIEAFRGQISGFHEPLASEFRDASDKWLVRARQQLEEVEAIVSAEPVKQVFRAGDPVNPKIEAFLPRIKVLGRLEQQVMLSTGCPGVLLYGRRRRGKSTVLRNLTRGGILPESVRSVSFSMEEPAALASLLSWCGRVAQSFPDRVPIADEFVAANPRTHVHASDVDSLESLFRFLSGWNEAVVNANVRLIVAIDEYEYIDHKIGEGIFSIDMLAMLRESIQSHRSLTWVFAGSHEIEELPNAPWTSFLVSARTIEVPNFTPEETRLLLTDPLRHSSAYGKDSPDRPTFDPSFWGVGGIERIHEESDGWPHLVQLIAETCVDMVNEEEHRNLTPELLERALDEAADRGRTVLSQLMKGESKLPGEWEYLSGFRQADEQAPPDDQAIDRSLRHREIVREEGGLWRLSAPLMGRWLRRHG